LLLDRLAQALITSGRNHSHGALLFIDLDNFKDLNDTQGHDVGDVLLERVANRLVTCIRQGDTVARLGGDEFVVMLENLNTNVSAASTQITVVADKILAALNLPFELSGKAHYSTPSIGITLFNGTQHSVDELLKRADLAMYQSKAAGRNTLRFFDPDMQASVAARAALEVDLRHGLEHGELVLYYQAVVNLKGKVTGVEALVRWHHPVRGLVAPVDFISVAEQTGLIVSLGQWVVKAACAQLVTWGKNPATKGLSIAVNISPKEFQQAGFVQHILDELHDSGANPSNLKLELTESLLLKDVQEAITKMALLRGAGVRFALDDFGTGYSSLAYLKQLPLDQLKIDQSFVRDVLTDPNDAVIARTIVALAHSLGLSVVAEGVETEGQRNFLAECGCKLFQGYLFGRPVAVNEVNLDAIATAYGATLPLSVRG
jgi:diguanylate cyclase (GGDEF)-like protein